MIKKIFSWQIIKYLIVGATGTALDLFFLYILVEYLHWHYLLAAFVSISVVIWLTFNLNKFWTFQNREEKYFFQFFKYLLSRGIGHLANLLILIFLVEIFNLWYILAKILAIAVAATVNFLLLKEFTFREQGQTGKIAFFKISK